MMSFGLAGSTIRAIFGLMSDVRSRFAPAVRVAAEAEVLAVAADLNRNIIEEFRKGTDSLGQSHDKSGYTVGTFHVEPHPLGAFVVLGGAAGLVEFGSKPHLITVKNARALHWTDTRGGDRFATVIHHPGYRGDPYIERGLARTDLGNFAARVIGAAYASMFLRSLRI